MVVFAEPLVTEMRTIPRFIESDRRTLFYTGAEIKLFKAEVRHMLKRRVFFDLKNSVVHTTPIVPGDQFGQLYYTPSELEQLEQDFVQSVKLEHANGEWDDDDKKPIASLVLERAKLREKYVASIRNKLVKHKIVPPLRLTPVVEDSNTGSSSNAQAEESTSLENARRINVVSSSAITTTTVTTKATKTGVVVVHAFAPKSLSCSPASSSSKSRRSRRSDSRTSSRSSSSSGRGPNGTGLHREGSGIGKASRRSSIDITKRHNSQQNLIKNQPKVRAMAA